MLEGAVEAQVKTGEPVIAEIMVPRSIVTVETIPTFGSGKRDYPGVARLLATRDIEAFEA